jgi:hypothetical protein
VGDGPIAELAAIPQVGQWVFVALVNGGRGQHLVGIGPPDDTHPEGQIVFDLVGQPPPDDTIVSLAGSGPPDDGMPLSEPMPVNLVAANGTRFVHRLTIPAEPSIGGTFDIMSLEGPHVAIGQVAVGSLAMVPTDGSGVLYDPGFNVNQGGVSGTLLTVFGSSLDLSPKTLKLSSRGRWITAIFEADNNRAGGILPCSIELHVGDRGFVMPSEEFTPQLGDADGDGNADWTVKFDRMMVQNLIPTGASEVMVTAKIPGVGFASALLKVIP